MQDDLYLCVCDEGKWLEKLSFELVLEWLIEFKLARLRKNVSVNDVNVFVGQEEMQYG